MRLEVLGPFVDSLEADAADRLLSSLRRTREGYPVDLVTPLLSRTEEPDTGRARLRDELLGNLLPTGFDWLDDAELDQAEKIGAYSIMLPWAERRETANAYFHTFPHHFDSKLLRQAATVLFSQLGLSNLRAAPLNFAYSVVPQDTNWGAPFFTSDKRFHHLYLDLAREIQLNGYRETTGVDLYAQAYWRGQAKGLGKDPKQRLVWGTSHVRNLLEQQLQIPMLSGARRLPEFASWVNQERVNAVASVLLELADEYDLDILSVDFKNFDQKLPREVISAVFSVIKGMFRQEYWPLIDYVESGFLQMKLITPDGILSGKSGSVPSGSTLTNWIDTLSHDLMWIYVSILLDNPILGKLFQGDDGVVLFERPWSMDEVVNIFADHFSMDIGAEKGGISRERVFFLQNVHSIDLKVGGTHVGVRPGMRVLNGAMSYEHKTPENWVPSDDTLRWWQQFENANKHPKFLRLAEFLYRHDRLSRSFSAAQILNKAGGWRQAESVLRQPSFPFGKMSLRGLHEFAIVRELEALRLGSGIRALTGR